MRHRRLGRVLGRSPSHRKALLRNLVKALILTEETDERAAVDGAPKVKGRITTTLQKAKEVRPVVEKCITIAKKALVAQAAASQFATTAERNSEAWQRWRQSDDHKKWTRAMAPAVAARRRIESLLGDVGDKHAKGDKRAVRILFDVIAPRFADRNGGYTRILKLAKPRLGDAGARAMLEFVGKNDRAVQKAPAPSFEGTAAPAESK